MTTVRTTMLTLLKSLPANVLLALLRLYRFLLSPWVGNSCRFWPTCSMYAMDAIERHGAMKGSYMMVTRVARCHPYSAGGVDEVPVQFRWRCWCQADAPAGATSAQSPGQMSVKAPAASVVDRKLTIPVARPSATAALTLQQHTNEV